MDTRISGRTRLLGLFGSPVGHSLSPVIYNFCFDRLGLDCAYLAFDCAEDDFSRALDAMRLLNMRGANVTMPCKRAAARLVDELSPAARCVGAVNTIVNDDGVLTGHMTDGMGVVLDLADRGIPMAGKRVVLLGAGGAASAVMAQCALDGAARVDVFNRGEAGVASARRVAEMLRDDGASCEVVCRPLGDGREMHDAVREADILINATPVGMRTKAEGVSLITDTGVFRDGLVVYDAVYDPPVTKLMSDAASCGCRPEHVIGGRGMLLWQAYGAFKLYTGLDMPVRELQAFLDKGSRS